VSALFPNIAQCVDDIALIRSMTTAHSNHYNATLGLHTGSFAFSDAMSGSSAREHTSGNLDIARMISLRTRDSFGECPSAGEAQRAIWGLVAALQHKISRCLISGFRRSDQS